jgi:hypothetical protein
MVTTTTWSMRELLGLGKSGSTGEADVPLLNGHDGRNAAAPEASTRFFTNSRRRIFKRTLREKRIGASLRKTDGSQPRAGVTSASFYENRHCCVNVRLKIEVASA